MNIFFAVLRKDIRLFLGRAGIAALILPLVLLAALQLGGGDLERQAFLQPFPIAIRDEDQTVMSRSLIQQIDQVSIFSQVISAEPEETDTQLLERGAAAVITIPKNFFYEMYTMNNQPVQVTLNRQMPIQANLLYGVFSSVLDIIAADQATGQAVYHFCYGSLTSDQTYDMWAQTANQLLQDALGRQQVFANDMQPEDLEADIVCSLFACALSVMVLFFPLAAVKSIPEERSSGILPRYIAAGGSVWIFCLSKCLSALLLTIPAFALMLAALPIPGSMQICFTALIAFLAAFGLLLALAIWADSCAAAQQWGNLFLLLSLILGGSIYPVSLYPPFAQHLAQVTLPYYVRIGVDLAAGGASIASLLKYLWPLLLMCIIGLFLAWLGLHRTPLSCFRTAQWETVPMTTCVEPPAARWTIYDLWQIARLKIRGMSGGMFGAIALLLGCLLCGLLCSYALGEKGPQQLTLAVIVEDPDAETDQLLHQLKNLDGLSVQEGTAEQAHQWLQWGQVEGILTIGAGYAHALEQEDASLPLTYESAAAAASQQAGREMIAGQVSVQLAQARGLRMASQLLGRSLSQEEQAALMQMMQTGMENLPSLYTLREDGSEQVTVSDPFTPTALGCVVMVVLFTLLTWGAWTGYPDARLVENRLRSVPSGAALSYLSDILALCLIGWIGGMVCLLAGNAADKSSIAALFFYVPCVAGITLFLTRFSALSGRIDILAPFLSLVTCLLGGCFGALDTLSPHLALLSKLTPQGMALSAVRGDLYSWWILVGAMVLFLWLGGIRKNCVDRNKDG